MRLKSAVFSNLYSFGQGVVCGFSYEGEAVKTLIIGRNNDDAGADSNGAGKSNILNSLFWIIFGEVFQEENADDIIRKGQTWCSGEAELVDGDTILKIARGRGNGSKKFLRVWYNTEEKKFNTDTETQKAILNYLHIPPSAKTSEYVNDFINIVYFSSDVVKGFMGKKTSSKDRFAVMERFLTLKRYSLASERAKAKKKELLDVVEKNLAKIAECEQYLLTNSADAYYEKIAQAQQNKLHHQQALAQSETTLAGQQERLLLINAIANQKQVMASTKESYIRAMDNLENEHKQNEATIAANNKSIEAYTAAKTAVEQQAPEFEAAKARKQELTALITEAYNTGSSFIAQATTLDKECLSLKNQISNSQHCPECGTALMIKDGKIDKANTAALQALLVGKEAEKTNISSHILEIVKNRTAFETESKELDETLALYKATQQAFQYLTSPDKLVADNNAKIARNAAILTEHAALGEEAKQKYGAMKTTLAQQEARFTELSATAVDVSKLQEDIRNSKYQISVCDNEVGSATQAIKNIEQTRTLLQSEQAAAAAIKKQADVFGFWETAFNEIKLDIIDEFLPDFEERTNDYLRRLKVDMTISFDTQKEKANASKKDKALGRAYKEEFSVEVCKSDNIPIPYALLSKGQRGRLGTCIGMALRELTKERGNNVFDFFFLDEIADALDESGLRELVSLLDNTAGQKLIISHNNLLKDYFDDTITVEITNGVSTIIQESA